MKTLIAIFVGLMVSASIAGLFINYGILGLAGGTHLLLLAIIAMNGVK